MKTREFRLTGRAVLTHKSANINNSVCGLLYNQQADFLVMTGLHKIIKMTNLKILQISIKLSFKSWSGNLVSSLVVKLGSIHANVQ